MHFDWQFFWKALFTPSEPFLDGLILTIVISVVAMILATLAGLVVALMRRSRFTGLRWCASVYIWVIRGTPLLVQLVLIYTGWRRGHLPVPRRFAVRPVAESGSAGRDHRADDQRERVYRRDHPCRTGFGAEGQFEAAASLGMKPGKVMRWIIVPQSLRVMVPPLGNSFNGMMKTTSVLSVIGVSEMFLVTQSISSYTFHTFEIFIVAAIYYLALTTIWTFIQAHIENRLARQLGIEQRVRITQRLLGARRAGPRRCNRKDDHEREGVDHDRGIHGARRLGTAGVLHAWRSQGLDDVSLDVMRGQVVVLIGPSGAGKTTLLRSLNQLEPVDSGEILIGGVPIGTATRLARRRSAPASSHDGDAKSALSSSISTCSRI